MTEIQHYTAAEIAKIDLIQGLPSNAGSTCEKWFFNNGKYVIYYFENRGMKERQIYIYIYIKRWIKEIERYNHVLH